MLRLLTRCLAFALVTALAPLAMAETYDPCAADPAATEACNGGAGTTCSGTSLGETGADLPGVGYVILLPAVHEACLDATTQNDCTLSTSTDDGTSWMGYGGHRCASATPGASYGSAGVHANV